MTLYMVWDAWGKVPLACIDGGSVSRLQVPIGSKSAGDNLGEEVTNFIDVDKNDTTRAKKTGRTSFSSLYLKEEQ
jgi:hypothetical protein